MRIATWNVEWPKARKEERLVKIKAALNQINADIWILTETHERVTPEEGYTFLYSEPIEGLLPGGERWVAVGIGSRWGDIQRIETTTPDIGLCVEIKTPNGSVVVYGTVLPYREMTWRESRKWWDAHYMAIACQAADWRRLQEHYPASLRILAGDFNQNRDGKHEYGSTWGRNLLSCALSTSGLTCVTDEDMIANKKLSAKRNIDHICLSGERASQASEPGVWNVSAEDQKTISDHNGVYIDLP